MKIKLLLLTVLWLIALALFALPEAHGQNTVVSYQGRATSNGTNFTGAGQFKFVLVTSTNTASTATATATVNNGFVIAYTVTFGGSSYVTPPLVTVSGGGGAGATATATISSGVVTAINAVTAGAGYTSPPTVTLSAAPDTIVYTTHWSHDGTSSAGSAPTSAVSVPVADGWFTAGLGDTAQTNMGALSAALFQRTNLQLRVWFSDGVNGFSVFHPAPRLTIAPYAGHAFSAGTINAPSNQPVSLTVNGVTVLRIEAVTNNFYGATANAIGGSSDNIISNGVTGGFIGGGGGSSGYNNRVGGNYASILGGLGNTASGDGSTAMGYSTTASGHFSVAIGFGVLASKYASTAMGHNTLASGDYATAMGYFSTASGVGSTAFGLSLASGHFSTAMGSSTASGEYSTAMGYLTTASGDYATAMGQNSDASGDYATAMSDSTASGSYALSAGYHSVASGDYSVALGRSSVASGNNSFAFGRRAIADNFGSLVWADNADADVSSSIANSVTMRAGGGYRLFSSSDLSAGVSLGGGHTSWGTLSDRNAKKDFTPVNSEEVLEKLAALPITRWHYRWEETNSPPHLGPMAQDFKAAFYPGTDDKTITTQEADGVALAAIQGLNQKLERKDAELNELKNAVRELQELVQALGQKSTQGAK